MKLIDFSSSLINIMQQIQTSFCEYDLIDRRGIGYRDTYFVRFEQELYRVNR